MISYIVNWANATFTPQFTTGSVDTILTDMVGDIGDVLASGLVIVLALVGVLVGLFFILRFVFKRIGRGK